MTDAQPTPTEHGPILEATEARQGFRGRHALWILVVSLGLVVVVLFTVWGSHSRQLASADPSRATQTSASESFNAPDPSAKGADIEKAPGVPGQTSPASPVTQTR